jgi:hypothetical protein
MPLISPENALNNAYKKEPIEKADIDKFKKELILLLDSIKDNPNEQEGHHKNNLKSFLQKTWYEPDYYINTKDNIDMVIHNGNNSKSPIGVIIETKKPGKNSEMVSVDNINVKSMQQLVLYYMREVIENSNLQIKNLIITNTIDWYIFDARVFNQYFLNNKEVRQKYNDHKNKDILFKSDTQFFYDVIAAPCIESIKNNISFTYFNLLDYEILIRNNNKENDEKLVYLYKILSPQHLLRRPFQNDNNSLNKNFYFELLYILGLHETKDNAKIDRIPKGKQQRASLLENAIFQLSDDIQDEDIKFNISLELVITWINRILFLKLLEAQLLTYQKGNKDFSFLNINFIKNYNELNTLFFKVLAREYQNRDDSIKEKYKNVPYLNSSLFEKTHLEEKCPISNLENSELEIFHSTVLRDEKGDKLTGKLNSLEYLFLFLDAYDFSNEGKEIIKEKHKTIINASVLGLIFEKINGYKDGSYFTPGFITNYICRETIRRAVVNKFNENKNTNFSDFDELKNYTYRLTKKEEIQEANKIVNSLSICDPAVGSGHFLVSALNEILSIKNDLGILTDKNNVLLRNCNLKIENDELLILDDLGNPFVYDLKNEKSKLIQESIFYEKMNIIEDCLFGIDINPKSVMICCLRLWIELLKNAYYTKESDYTELETLPNIDINIKCGNSLISRFEIDIDLKYELKNLDYSVEAYQNAVKTLKNTANKEQKQHYYKLINLIKNNFRQGIKNNNDLARKKDILIKDIEVLNADELFALSTVEKKAKDDKIKDLLLKIKNIDEKQLELENDIIYEEAFEWRFEFPEILNSDGNFKGFDVVIANPPYIGESGNKELFRTIAKTDFGLRFYKGKMDYFYFFIHKAIDIGSKNCEIAFITTNYFLTAYGAKKLREDFYKRTNFRKIINFNELKIFESAMGQHNMITQFTKSKIDDLINICICNHIGIATQEIADKILSSNDDDCIYLQLNKDNLFDGDESYIRLGGINKDDGKSDIFSILDKMAKSKYKLSDISVISQGLVTGCDTITKKHLEMLKNKNIIKDDGIYVLDLKNKRDLLIYNNLKKEKILLRNFYKNSDIHRYLCDDIPTKKIIYFQGELKKKLYPDIFDHLSKYKIILENRLISYNEKYHWTAIHRPRDENIFIKPKIVTPYRSQINSFAYNECEWFCRTDTYVITAKNNKANLKYILGLLNSKLYFHWLYNRGKRKGEILELFYAPLCEIPIPETSSENKMKIETIVNKIIKIKKEKPNQDTLKLEKEIDSIIYQIFNLSNEEIDIIEGK